MRFRYLIGASLLTLVTTTAALATPKHAARRSAGGGCASLNGDMEHLKKSLAMNFADGIGDDSAPRATMRETEYQSLLARVRLTMDLMRDQHCPLPRSVPTGVEYTSDAITCQTDKMAGRASAADSCDQSSWRPKAR